MNAFESRKKSILPYCVAVLLFVGACLMQQFDDHIADWNASRLVALLAQLIFLGILAYWTASVINRVSDKGIRIGLAITIITMSSVLLLKIVKYNVVYERLAERYLWYSYYIPQCLAPVFLLITAISTARKKGKRLSYLWYLLFIPAVAMILLVFTNDLHQQVFIFPEGLQKANEIYKWNWGYYMILTWISGLYFTNGVLLFIKCRISHSRKKAWIPLVLFVVCLTFCIVREVLNPAFIKMPETVVFSVVIVCESLIIIGFIPSNFDHAKYFDVSDVSAIIADNHFDFELFSENAPCITKEQAIVSFRDGELSLTKDLILKAKAITGGEVFWTEDMAIINRINDDLSLVNSALAEEIDLISAENRIKEQRSIVEEQNALYKEFFNIAKPHLKKIGKCLSKATTDEEKDNALRLSVVYGVFLKRRSNLMLLKRSGNISIGELVYALRESVEALTFCNVYSSVFANCDGDFPAEQIELIFDFFEDCIECALPELSACLVRLSVENGSLSCRVSLDNVTNTIRESWYKKECEKLGADLTIIKSDETLYATLSFAEKGVEA